MNNAKQQRLRELALIMLRDAHGEDFTAEQAALLPGQREEFARLVEPAEILSLFADLDIANARVADHAERARQLQQGHYIPGQMHCAKCKFQLTRSVSCMGSGTIGAGDNKTEPCPNGCGPLWPGTWKQADQENQEIIGRLCDEQRELRAQVEQLQPDADRYRHLRSTAKFQYRNGPGLYWYLPRYLSGSAAEQLDQSIDLSAGKGAGANG